MAPKHYGDSPQPVTDDMDTTAEYAPSRELQGERRLGQQIHRFSNMVQASYYGRTEQPLGIALSEWRVLRAAILKPGVSQAEVAAGEGINVMSVSRAVAGLKRKRLIDVENDPEDRRRTMLKATTLGIELGADIGERERVVYEHIFSVLSGEEQLVLDKLLTKTNDQVQNVELPTAPGPSRDWSKVLLEPVQHD